MFTALVLIMLAAIAVSFLRREQRKKTAHQVARGADRMQPAQRKAIPIIVAAIIFAVGGSVFLALALSIDNHIFNQPTASKTAPPPPPSEPGPGPGWKADQGAPLPPSGFTGRMTVRSEQGLSAKGLVVVARGQFRRLGWRITGDDAAYCSLDVELLARPEHRKLDSDGYSYTETVLDEGWHEARVQAWCPPEHTNARFTIATQNVAADGHITGNGTWNEAGDDDIRHR